MVTLLPLIVLRRASASPSIEASQLLLLALGDEVPLSRDVVPSRT